MKSLSMKAKIFFLSGVIIGLLLMVGGVGIYAVEHLSKSVVTVSQQSLPAVRNMTLVDMMHDGLRAVVYRSLVATPEEKAEIEAEYKEFSGNINVYLNEIKKLDLDPKLKAIIEKAEVTIKQYQTDSEYVIMAALSGDKPKAEAYLPTFMKSFSALAQELELIGRDIQKNAEEQSTASQAEAAKLSQLSLYVVGFGVFVSLLVLFAVYSFITKLTSGIIHITDGLKTETGLIVETSRSMANVATKLSEASTEQAASLQETVASIDEISAMITRNADSASSSSETSLRSTQIAQKEKNFSFHAE